MTEKRYKWGYHVEDLARAVEETRRILVEVAKNENTISYTDLCNRIMAVRVEPESYALAYILGCGPSRPGATLDQLVLVRMPGPAVEEAKFQNVMLDPLRETWKDLCAEALREELRRDITL